MTSGATTQLASSRQADKLIFYNKWGCSIKQFFHNHLCIASVCSFVHLPLMLSNCNSGTTYSGSVYSASWGKTCVGIFCLHLNAIDWSGHVTSTICRDNWLGFKSLWLGYRISAYGQVLGWVVPCLELGFCSSLNANKKLLTACQLWNHCNTCRYMWDWAVTDVTVN